MSSPQPRHPAMGDSSRQSESQFRRVFVILDVTSDPTPALESAAELAARLEAPLVGLFVEHGQLQRLEGHPSARGIDLPTGLMGSLEADSMRRGWRAMASRMHNRLAELSQRYRLESQFELLRGEVRNQLTQLTESSDLLVVESSGRHVTRHVRIQSRGHDVGRRLPGPVMFVGSRHRRIRSVAAVYDGSLEARRGIETALQMASHGPSMLTLLLVAKSSDEAEQLHEQIADIIQQRGVRVRPHVRRITCCDTGEIAHVADNVHARFVIVPGNDDYPGPDDIDGLTRRLDCPVLVMRRAGTDQPDDDRPEGDESTDE